jgi:hypothetical protein
MRDHAAVAQFSSLLLNFFFVPALPQIPLQLFADCTNNMELTLPPPASTFATPTTRFSAAA